MQGGGNFYQEHRRVANKTHSFSLNATKTKTKKKNSPADLGLKKRAKVTGEADGSSFYWQNRFANPNIRKWWVRLRERRNQMRWLLRHHRSRCEVASLCFFFGFISRSIPVFTPLRDAIRFAPAKHPREKKHCWCHTSSKPAGGLNFLRPPPPPLSSLSWGKHHRRWLKPWYPPLW